MKRNLISQEERLKCQVQLETAIKHSVEHISEEPHFDFEHDIYEGGTEPILVAISQALRWGAKSILDNLTEEEKAVVLIRMNKS